MNLYSGVISAALFSSSGLEVGACNAAAELLDGSLDLVCVCAHDGLHFLATLEELESGHRGDLTRGGRLLVLIHVDLRRGGGITSGGRKTERRDGERKCVGLEVYGRMTRKNLSLRVLFALTNVTLGYSSAHLTNMGAILWQGPHHDAVKSTTTSLEAHRNKRESTLERSRRRRRVRAECRRFGVGRGEGGWAPSFSEHALVGAADARIELRLGLELSHHDDTRKKRIGESPERTSF